MSKRKYNGPRLIAIDRTPDGFGFHMYTNKQLNGQYIKSVNLQSPAYRAGMMAGDHVIEVDGENVEHLTHQEVVKKIQSGAGIGKRILVIDQETERLFKVQGLAITEGAKLNMDYVDSSSVSPPPSSPSGPMSPTGPGTFPPSSMAAAIPQGRKKSKEAKSGDWASKKALFDNL